MLQTPIKLFRFMGILEGSSLLILLAIAMPLKYMLDLPLAVRIAGSLHGLLFILYLLVIAYTAYRVRWFWKWIFGAVAVAFIPFGNFILDYILRQKIDRK
jgi:integral membrane protein